MKKAIYLMTFFFLAMGSCKKEETKVQNGFSCKVNGIPWRPVRADAILADSPYGFTYYSEETNLEDWENSMVMFGSDPQFIIPKALRTNISLKNVFFGEGRYEIMDDSTSWARGYYTFEDDTIPWDLYESCLGGFVEFKSFEGPWDNQPWRILAEFEYTLLGNNGDTLYITDGVYRDYD